MSRSLRLRAYGLGFRGSGFKIYRPGSLKPETKAGNLSHALSTLNSTRQLET